jgi:hypothetical protein
MDQPFLFVQRNTAMRFFELAGGCMLNLFKISFGIILTSWILGCGSDHTAKVAVPGFKNRVKWASIPSEYNPQVSDITFNTNGAETIRLNIFGFAADVEVNYSENVPAGQAYLRTYKVSKNAVSWAPINSELKGKSLNISASGNYACSVKVENGNITKLEGGCYIRLQVLLPADSDLAVYNLNQLISTKARLMSTDELVTSLENASWVGDQRKILNDFLDSYQQAGKQPAFTSNQLGDAIHTFNVTADKLKVLRRLHGYVSDRENLRSMIDREFPEHARGEARVIAGV